jgi:hypothetical protein
MKTENLNRKEAVLACLDGYKVRHIEMPKDIAYIKGGFCKVHNLHDAYSFSDGLFLREDGYFIVQEPLTFATIRKECEPMKHLLVDKNGNKRLYLGFTRSGRVATDNYASAGCTSWTEIEVDGWTVEPYEGE